jgi:hypothetical protein
LRCGGAAAGVPRWPDGTGFLTPRIAWLGMVRDLHTDQREIGDFEPPHGRKSRDRLALQVP